MIILGVETSCDETSVSVVVDGKKVLSNIVYSQIDFHKVYGGVVPEVASRHHLRKITVVFSQALEVANIKPHEVDLICVTKKPGLIGSLFVGVNASKVFSLIYKVKYIEVDHIIGHIYANQIENTMKFPLISLVVSGGHTELLYMENHYQFKLLGTTLDDAVGEAYDKVGRVMGLDYPAGKYVDNLASLGENTYKLPIVSLGKDNYNFSFSGLKSSVLNIINKNGLENININNLCASFQESVVKVLVLKTVNACLEYKVNQVLIAGGVACNSYLRKKLKVALDEINVEFIKPSNIYCTDNAAMIAVAGYYKHILETSL